ncbi:MAG: glycoside hydrolase [Akkermansiaceae bacterium]|nr:glycoside hydrolase [Akkermansiaceae bacterium]
MFPIRPLSKGSLALLLLLPPSLSAASRLASLSSPDHANSITLSLDASGTLTYEVARKGKTVIAESPLGLQCPDQDFTRGLKLDSPGKEEKRKETYQLLTGVKTSVDQPHVRRSLSFTNATGAHLVVELDAGNEGVAFRYRFPETKGERTVEKELTGFQIATEARAWISPYNQASGTSPAYEDFYFAVKPGDAPPNSRYGPTKGWYFPALFETPAANAWTLITETTSSGGDYCGCHLDSDSKGGLYKIAFPFPDEGMGKSTDRPPTSPHHSLPWTMPWRVIILGDKAGDILTSTLVTDLAPPSEVANSSWIKSGRASWSWWAYPDGHDTTERYTDFIHAASKNGWEYSLLDAGWWKADMKALAETAKKDKVELLVWTHSGDFIKPDARTRKLDEIASYGATGVKIDFWCSDRQETLAAMADTLKEAAAKHLTVNFHGCTLPRGWQRTYPNFVSAEAVLGTESYMFDEHFTDRAAFLNTILPFTRNVAGPMDATPFALSPKQYPRKTTAAHEMATAIVFTSGIIHYADKPEVYAALPEAAQQVMKDAPARWDETRFLAGEPGKLVVVARRSGTSWFIAGLNGTPDSQPVKLDLSPFKGGKRTLIDEGKNPAMELQAAPAEAGNSWSHTLPGRGGFVLRIDTK